jgi:hypothetical protein
MGQEAHRESRRDCPAGSVVNQQKEEVERHQEIERRKKSWSIDEIVAVGERKSAR